MLHRQGVGGLADPGPRRGALRGVVLQLRRQVVALLDGPFGVLHGETRDLVGDRLALAFVGVQDLFRRPPIQVRRQQPGQVHGVGDAGVHAVAGVGHPQVGGVAADEHPPVPEPLGHQPPADPVLIGQELVFEVRPHPQDGADAAVAVHRREVPLVALEVVMDQPGLFAVDGDEVAGALGVVDVAHPGRPPLDHGL